MERIMRLAALSLDRQPDNLEFLALRKHSPETRLAIIEQVIYGTGNLGLVIIDGMSDLGYGELLTALKQGYESIRYSYGRNKITALKVFLYNKRMIIQENEVYRFNPNFYY